MNDRICSLAAKCLPQVRYALWLLLFAVLLLLPSCALPTSHSAQSPAVPLPELVGPDEEEPFIWANMPGVTGTEPKTYLVYSDHMNAIWKIAERDPLETRAELLRRLADDNRPMPTRLLYAGILAGQGDSVGQNFLIERANEAATLDQAQDVLWVMCSLDQLIAWKSAEEKPVSMDWAKDFMIALLLDDRTVTTGPEYQQPLQKRAVALDRFMGGARVIARIKDERIAPALMDLYRKQTPGADSDDLLIALGEMMDPRTEPFFLEILRAHDHSTYWFAVSGLAALKSPQALPIMLEHLDDADTYSGLSHYQDERILPAVKKALPSLKGDTRCQARLLIIDLEGGDRLPKLIECARAPDFEDHYEAMHRILELKDERSVGFAAEQLNSSPELYGRIVAIRILARLQSRAAVKALIEALDMDFKAVAHGKERMADNDEQSCREIASHLKAMTGQDFGVDKARWLQWYNESQTPANVSSESH